MSRERNVVSEVYEKELKVGYGQFMDVMRIFADTIDSDKGIIIKSESHESFLSRLLEYPNKLDIVIDISKADPSVINKCTAKIVTDTVNIIEPDALYRDNVPFLGRRLYTRRMILNRLKGVKYYSRVQVRFDGKNYIHKYDYSVNPDTNTIPAFSIEFSHSLVNTKNGCYLNGYDDTSLNSVSVWVNAPIVRKYYDRKLFEEWIVTAFTPLSTYTSNQFEFRKVVSNVGVTINMVSELMDTQVSISADAHTIEVDRDGFKMSDNDVGIMVFRSRYLTEKTFRRLLTGV